MKMARISIFLIIVAVIVGLVGCAPAPTRYNLTISSTDGGSVITPGDGSFTYNDGTVVNLVAVEAEQGYQFVTWSGDVDTIANVNAARTTITMNGDYSVTANFVRIYSLTVSSTAGGSVTAPGQGAFYYRAGMVVDLAARADEGHQFLNWSGDVGEIADIEDATTVITMDSHYSITANFVEGDVAPDFTLPTMTGASITLSELKGTPVVLNFWSIPCPYCRVQLPYLEDIAQQSEFEIKVIAVNIVDTAASLHDFFGDYEPTMIIAVGQNSETFADYCQKYGNSRGAIPFTLFVDGEGMVKYVKIGAFSSEAQLWDTVESVFGIQ
jgi:thiol-disulfide isomerase/thioredoxin